jgi:hypothetical protein
MFTRNTLEFVDVLDRETKRLRVEVCRYCNRISNAGMLQDATISDYITCGDVDDIILYMHIHQ